jgi:hypothetical protein
MKELDLQDKYLINFFCERADGLRYKEAKANTVSPNQNYIPCFWIKKSGVSMLFKPYQG